MTEIIRNSVVPAPDGPFIHPRAAEPTGLFSSHHRPGPKAVTGHRPRVRSLVQPKRMRHSSAARNGTSTRARSYELAEGLSARARAGGDPLTEQRHAPHVPTVEEAAAVVLEQQRSGWRHARYERDWPRSLRAYAFPRIGAMP